ncbi:hypothetical protein F383_33876 [Gossypium arboreum]|uniref:Uncharacterized protein n=1 Tax=Gossypium arboreum TaxID=29729 RepID=A0A0B0N0K1_GOSAR|nr:hypothetical protein F383_33876 [Gossypium arboreum]
MPESGSNTRWLKTNAEPRYTQKIYIIHVTSPPLQSLYNTPCN